MKTRRKTKKKKPTTRKNKHAVHFSSAREDWATPEELFNKISEKYGPFQLDVCATKENAKCPFYYTKEIPNGLLAPWYANAAALANGITLPGKPACWMNPPYGRNVTNKWVKKAYEEAQKGCLVVALLPARTDTRFYHNYIYGPLLDSKTIVSERDQIGGWLHGERVSICKLKGRVQFEGAEHGAPFPSLIAVFHPPPHQQKKEKAKP